MFSALTHSLVKNGTILGYRTTSANVRLVKHWWIVPKELVSALVIQVSRYNIQNTVTRFFSSTEIASEGLKGRVFEVSLADLQNDTDAERSYRKFRLIAEDVQGMNVLTNFHGMDLTTDKLRSMVKKWQVCGVLDRNLGFMSSISWKWVDSGDAYCY